jgi:hypothetical protein
MECIQDNYTDINRYYKKTYIKLAEFGDKLFFVNEVDSDGIYLTDREGVEYKISLHNDAPYNIDLIFPHKTLYQYGDYCALLTRVPARQYHRGIANSNCSISVLTQSGWEDVGLNWEVLEAYVYKPQFKSLEQALKCNNSYALSPTFAVVYSDEASHNIYCYNNKVGKVNRIVGKYNINPLILPEFNSLLISTNMSTRYVYTEEAVI